MTLPQAPSPTFRRAFFADVDNGIVVYLKPPVAQYRKEHERQVHGLRIRPR